MIRPPSRSRSRDRWTMKNGARVFTAKTRSYSSSVTAAMGRGRVMPALLTRMSSPGPEPVPDSASSKAAQSVAASPSTPSSAWTGKARPPSVSISLTVRSAAAWSWP